MHLMYYEGADGKRVYTLKVSTQVQCFKPSSRCLREVGGGATRAPHPRVAPRAAPQRKKRVASQPPLVLRS